MLVKSHFEDCPYNCNVNGMVLDADAGKLIPCPHCSKRKRELLKQGYVETEEETQVPLSTVLGIKNEYLSTKFVYDSVVPDGERLFIDEESLDWQSNFAEELYLGLTVGTLPEESICFGLSIKGRLERFVYPMLAKGYLAGLTIGKFVTCSEFNRLSFDISNPMDDFYNADILFMLINDGSNLSDLASAKGLMQTRALKGKATLFVTTWTIEACSGLLGFNGDSSLALAKPVFLQYKKGKSKGHSSYVNQLIGVENESLAGTSSDNSVSMKDLLDIN